MAATARDGKLTIRPLTAARGLHDDFAFFGTEAMFRKAGFKRIRGILRGLPKGWTPRVTMRAECRPSPISRRRSAA
jgi:hypothetical protein